MTLRDRLFLFASAVGNRLAALWAVVNTLAPLDSPFFTGQPKAPTAAQGANHDLVATVGHVVDAVGSHTHPVATLEANGLFTSAEKAKLAGVEEGANLYIHPPGHTALEVSTTQDRQFVTQAEKDFWSDQLVLGETSSTAHRGDHGDMAYLHSLTPHAPIDAQKNSDITKEEIEAVLVGPVESHEHLLLVQQYEWVLVENIQLLNGQEEYLIAELDLPVGEWDVFYDVQFRSTSGGEDHYVAGVKKPVAGSYIVLSSGQASGYGLSGHFARVSGRAAALSNGTNAIQLYAGCLTGGIHKFVVTTTDFAGTAATKVSARLIREISVEQQAGFNISDDLASADNQHVATGNVLTNDDIDIFVYSVGGSVEDVGMPVTGSNGGTFTISANGDWTFDPGTDFDWLLHNQTQSTVVAYEASNGFVQESATLTVLVERYNQAPVTVNDAVFVWISESATGNVLSNDSDPDGDTIYVSKVAGSAINIGASIPGSNGGLFIIAANGDWSFDQNDEFLDVGVNQDRVTSISYHASDSGAETIGTLTVTVKGARTQLFVGTEPLYIGASEAHRGI